jgi:hypothetical protein
MRHGQDKRMQQQEHHQQRPYSFTASSCCLPHSLTGKIDSVITYVITIASADCHASATTCCQLSRPVPFTAGAAADS